LKIAIVSAYVPFLSQPLLNNIEKLSSLLQEQGHEVEQICLPFINDTEKLLEQIVTYRLINLTATADKVITLNPPAHVLQHPNKINWFIKDWDSYFGIKNYRDGSGSGSLQQDSIYQQIDTVNSRTLKEAKKLFAASKMISEQMKDLDSLKSEILYPPLPYSEYFRCDGYNDEIVCLADLKESSRLILLLDAMRFVKSAIRLRFCAESVDAFHVEKLKEIIIKHGLGNRIIFQNKRYTTQEKIDILAAALAGVYLPANDSFYGYSSLEIFHAQKPILTTNDSGSLTELVIDGYNGYIVDPTSQAIAEGLDKLYLDRKKTIAMGECAAQRIIDLKITWKNVMERLLS